MNPADRHGDPSCWHALSADAAVAMLGSDAACGLTAAEAAARLEQHGPNRLAEAPPRPAWLRFLDYFRSTLVLLLMGAGALAWAIGDVKDAVVVGFVVLFNATLGFLQENRAEAALAALKGMLAPTARVRRDGRVELVAAETLVPGDILLLAAGDRIPADARVLVAHAAEVAEAALTGESQPVTKAAAPVGEAAPLAERYGMVFMNCVMTRGRIEAVVTATGMATETGRLAGLLAATPSAPTPLQRQLDALGKRLTLIAGSVVGLIFVAGLLRGEGLVPTAMTAVALAVAAIPEGLPAVVTVTLALGMHRMARRHAVVRRMAAVETLGCVSAICSDKTGTLTQNRMAVAALYCAGSRYAPDTDALPAAALLPAALCVDAVLRDGAALGGATEGALLALAARAGLDAAALAAASPRLAEIPFAAEHRYMATFHGDGDHVRLWLKGAPDELLARAARRFDGAGEVPLDAAARADFAAEAEAMAGSGMRVLALAGRRIPAADFAAGGELARWVDDLAVYALIGIADPLRAEASAAVATCRAAGIRVWIVTGDHRLTAAAIARELGLEGEVREGAELDGLDAAALAALAQRTAAFARVAPEHKIRIVEALRAGGHVVAMTGDGVNDAPALKAADIGVAMGATGTEVARQAADLVLADDNFATIVHAVREGRTLYDNIVKFVRFQLTTNVGAILAVLGAPFLGFATPFTAIQILWVNIIMDGPPAMTLGLEPARRGLMAEPPRPVGAAILSWPRLRRVLLGAAIMAAGTLALYGWGLGHGGPGKAATLAFTVFVLFQLFNIFNARAEHGSAFNAQFFANGRLWLAVAATAALQVVAVHWGPAQAVFSTVDLSFAEWALAVLVASSVLALEEARKFARRCRR